MDNLDKMIKERLQEDKIISKKAENVFNNFLKEDFSMKKQEEKEVKPKKKIILKNILSIAACLVIALGAGNIYATSKGYENVFFLIKYLVSGDDSGKVNDKDEILSDRDMVISYQPITLTENIRMQVRNIQIKDNEAKLYLLINETEAETNRDIVPLKYKVYNNSNKLLCNENSSKKSSDETIYQEILELKDFNETREIVLEVYKSNDEKLIKMNINLDTKEIIVEGEKEALQKISEIELKQYLAYYINNNHANGYPITIFNIDSISCSSGLYKATFQYANFSEENSFDIDYNNLVINNATIYFKLNENSTSSKFEIIKYIDSTERFNDIIDENEDLTNTILNNIKTYLTNVNNTSIQNKYNTIVMFRKYTNGNLEKDVETSTYLFTEFLSKINPYVEKIDNSTTYAQWCRRSRVEAKERYSIMFMFEGHQTQITYGDTADEKQIVMLWYNEKIQDIEIDKINLKIDAKKVFRELINNYPNSIDNQNTIGNNTVNNTSSNNTSNTNTNTNSSSQEELFGDESKRYESIIGTWGYKTAYLNDSKNKIYKEVQKQEFYPENRIIALVFGRDGSFSGNIPNVTDDHNGVYTIDGEKVYLYFDRVSITLDWPYNSNKMRLIYQTDGNVYEIILEYIPMVIVKKVIPQGWAGSSLHEVILYENGDAYQVTYADDEYDKKNIAHKELIAKYVEDIESRGGAEGGVILKGKNIEVIKNTYGWIIFEK